MIIKGTSRGAPGQLAWHLQRRDTNEKVDILELQSCAPNLKEAFRDWQTLVEGTRGKYGLYHANIDPAAGYTMTRQQWQRAVEVLENELKLDGQPRAVVLHEKHGRTHIHVVWARTDIDRMVLRSDSQNYMAHERASKKLEREFGHEHVPGKHAKRDRKKQPEFPKAKANQAEWQQGERTGIDPAIRKAQITGLKQASDNAAAFKAALEDHGYILAKGDRRDFVIVDETGSIHSLGRQVQGMKAAELRAFMKSIDRDALPTTSQAVDVQRQLQKATNEAEIEPPEPLSEKFQDAQAKGVKDALQARQAAEREELLKAQAAEREQLEKVLKDAMDEKLADRDAMHKAAMGRLRREQAARRSLLGALVNRVSPSRAAKQKAAERRERAKLAKQQRHERAAYAASLKEANDLEIEDLEARHALQREGQANRSEEEHDRYQREHARVRELRQQREERKKQEQREEEEQLKRNERKRPPPRAR